MHLVKSLIPIDDRKIQKDNSPLHPMFLLLISMFLLIPMFLLLISIYVHICTPSMPTE